MRIRTFLEETTDTAVKAVTFEDSAALVGLVLAALGLGLTTSPGTRSGTAPARCSSASCCVVAVSLARANSSLLVGRAAPLGARPRAADELESLPDVTSVPVFVTSVTGPRRLLVAAKVEFRDGCTTDDIERVADEAERRLVARFPGIEYVFLDPSARTRRPRHLGIRHAADRGWRRRSGRKWREGVVRRRGSGVCWDTTGPPGAGARAGDRGRPGAGTRRATEHVDDQGGSMTTVGTDAEGQTSGASDGSGAPTVRVSRTVGAPLVHVWEVLVSPAGAQALLGQGAVLGGKGEPYHSADGTSGVVRSYHPLEQLRVSWHVTPDSPPSIVELDLAADGDGSTRSSSARTTSGTASTPTPCPSAGPAASTGSPARGVEHLTRVHR